MILFALVYNILVIYLCMRYSQRESSFTQKQHKSIINQSKQMKTFLAILGVIYLVALASSVIVLIVIACKAF